MKSDFFWSKKKKKKNKNGDSKFLKMQEASDKREFLIKGQTNNVLLQFLTSLSCFSNCYVKI